MDPDRKVVEAIEANLSSALRRRRSHFLPATLLATAAVAGVLIAGTLRPDLLEQAPSQLTVQALLWVLCLLVLPAIGVGVLFVGRTARIALIVAAIVATAAATTGWPLTRSWHAGHAEPIGGCLALVGAVGVLLLGLGFISGAFVQRRRASSVFWVAAGLSLAALNVATWHCPITGLLHVVPGHLGGAALLLVLAAVVGMWAHRRARTIEHSSP
jgi:hypothetical protein